MAQGFLKPAHRELVISGIEPGALIERLEEIEVPLVEKWIRVSET